MSTNPRAPNHTVRVHSGNRPLPGCGGRARLAGLPCRLPLADCSVPSPFPRVENLSVQRSGLVEARAVLAAVKTTAYGGGLRPVLTAAARGAVRCIWPGRRNGSATEQRNTLNVCHPELLARHLPRTLSVNLLERRSVSFNERRRFMLCVRFESSGAVLELTIFRKL